MKKILLFIIAGVIGLGLTSCVKNEESASVTELRNAKAAQLASLAALNNAQAEAILIDANANKALAEAEAAYSLARAAYQAAMAEGEDINNQMAEIELQIAQETLEIEIQAAILQAQANLADAQAAFEVAKARLILALDNVADAERNRINALIAEADWVFDNLRRAQNDLIYAQEDLLNAQYALATAEELKEQTTRENEAKIAAAKAQIEALNELGNAEYEGIVEEIGKVETLVAQYDVLLSQYTNDWLLVSDLVEDSYNQLTNLTPTGIFSYINYEMSAVLTIDYSAACEVENIDRIYYYYTPQDQLMQGWLMYAGKDTYQHYVDIMVVHVDSLVIKGMEAEQQRQVDILTPEYEAAEKAYKEALDPEKTADYKTKLDNLAKAEKDYADAKKEGDKAKMQTADAAIATAKAEIETYEAGVKTTYYNATLPYFEAITKLEAYDNLLSSVCREEGKYYEELVEALNGEDGLLDKLQVAYTYRGKARSYYNYYNDYLAYLVYIRDSGLVENVDAVIANLQTQINGWQKDIDDCRAINTQEQLISLYTSQIAKLEAQIEVLQAQYDALIAEIQTVIEDAE